MLDDEGMPVMCSTTLLCEGFEAKCARIEGHGGHHVATVFGRNFEWLWCGGDWVGQTIRQAEQEAKDGTWGSASDLQHSDGSGGSGQ